MQVSQSGIEGIRQELVLRHLQNIRATFVVKNRIDCESESFSIKIILL